MALGVHSIAQVIRVVVVGLQRTFLSSSIDVLKYVLDAVINQIDRSNETYIISHTFLI